MGIKTLNELKKGCGEAEKKVNKETKEMTDLLDIYFWKGYRLAINNLKEEISSKVLLDWKGQNEFVDWLEKECKKNRK